MVGVIILVRTGLPHPSQKSDYATVQQPWITNMHNEKIGFVFFDMPRCGGDINTRYVLLVLFAIFYPAFKHFAVKDYNGYSPYFYFF